MSLAFLLTAFLALSCGDQVAAPEGVDEPFSAYGILNPRLARQTMMVASTSRELLDYSESIDASVSSVNAASGLRHVWRDSVVMGDRSQRDHIFVADFRPDFGSRHRIEIERSDGAQSRVDVQVPSRVQFELEDDGSSRIRVRLIGEEINLVKASVTYGVRQYQTRVGSVTFCNSPLAFYDFPLESKVRHVPGSVEIEIDMQEDEAWLRSYYAIDYDVTYSDARSGLALTHMDLEVTVGNESWAPPDGEFDPLVLASPGVLANLTNGFGFVGSGYNQDWGLWPSQASVSDTRFFDGLMRPPGNCLDYCSCGIYSK